MGKNQRVRGILLLQLNPEGKTQLYQTDKAPQLSATTKRFCNELDTKCCLTASNHVVSPFVTDMQISEFTLLLESFKQS
jgi:hypothetical protein